MREINRMGLRVVGTTAAVMLVLLGLYLGSRALLQRDKGEQVAPGEALSIAEGRRDSDGDGVADLYETTFYNTDPTNADTDGDGVSDLDEITAGRDPTLAGPDDVSRPVTGSAVVEPTTNTEQYLAGLPDDIPRERILDQVALDSYVNANRGKLLPEIAPNAIITTSASGKEAISTYLDNISAAHNTDLQAVTSTDIEAAFRLQVSSGQIQEMQNLVTILANNVTVLKAVSAPTEVVALHTKLVAASQALSDNTKLLSDISQDFVGGLVAARNIEDLGAIFQELANEIKALEGKYELE